MFLILVYTLLCKAFLTNLYWQSLVLKLQINFLQFSCVYEMFDHYIAFHFCKF